MQFLKILGLKTIPTDEQCVEFSKAVHSSPVKKGYEMSNLLLHCLKVRPTIDFVVQNLLTLIDRVSKNTLLYGKYNAITQAELQKLFLEHYIWISKNM